MGCVNPRILSGLFFIIPESLASICVVVLSFTTNRQSNTLNTSNKVVKEKYGTLYIIFIAL